MKQEDKWPVFHTSPKMPAKFAKESDGVALEDARRQSSEMFEEMSGMVTLKRKVKDNGLRPSSPLHTMF